MMARSSLDSFAALLDRLAFEPRRNGKLMLMTDWFRATPDPERGYALAAMTGGLVFRQAKAGLIRDLIAERCDPTLFALSYDYVGDLSETVALLWEPPDAPGEGHNQPPPSLSDVVGTLSGLGKLDLRRTLATWLDGLDPTGRWALLKLITGGLRVGVSARLARTAVGALGGKEPDEIEQVWHGLTPPYPDLFAWLEGRGERPVSDDPAPFRPPMLAHAIEDADFDRLDPADFTAEWKWDGIRIQAASGVDAAGRRVTRLYSRTGEEITGAFPDLADAIDFDGALDGELLILQDGRVQSFNVLQQRLNRKHVTAKLIAQFPAHLRAYDLLVDGATDIRELPFLERRRRLEALPLVKGARLSLSPLVQFRGWDALAEVRADPSAHGAGDDAEAVEGLMIKRLDSVYQPGRPKGLWFKWKRDPMVVDAVLMYAQRGHGKRSSFYSDFTFGVWRSGASGDELTPVGKAYFGFTDEELKALDRHVRKHTVDRFGPVRAVAATREAGLVLEIAFEGINRSPRHKSGVAMRFPRISRIRWDKPAAEADRLETLEKLIDARGSPLPEGATPTIRDA
jgi:DNA ligase-1